MLTDRFIKNLKPIQVRTGGGVGSVVQLGQQPVDFRLQYYKNMEKINLFLMNLTQTFSDALKSAIVLLLLSSVSLADSLDVLQGHEDELPDKIIPYAFYNDTTDAAIAGAFVAQGYIQPQVNIVTNAFYSSNSSHNFFYLLQDLQLPFNECIFVDVIGFKSEWGIINSYRDGNLNFPDERAVSNDSHEDNFIESEGSDALFRLDFRYLLPIGHAKNTSIHKYVVEKNGLLVSGSESGGDKWNPLESGRTFVNFQFFDREQDLEDNQNNKTKLQTTASSLGLDYDNTDYWRNPTYGSRQSITVTHDWGSNHEVGEEWTTIEAEYSKFFSLGVSEEQREVQMFIGQTF
ncbi:MAG: hypothetical protein KZQ83_10410 [gamma proteobacterium symbiont of Taylorina sp.]|nr:hypothetical protein [gamma proteobacterium symbiont of Taylorina sp.]